MAEPPSGALPYRLLFGFSGAMALGLVATILWAPRPRLIWNASPSSPTGLYRLSDAGDGFRPGQYVAAWAPPHARAFAARRHYLPPNIPLIKQVSAGAGAQVCAEASAIRIDGRLVARRLAVDSLNRPLPWWTGCERVRRGDLFLLSRNPRAFDGRYFGITGADQIVGKAVLIWAI